MKNSSLSFKLNQKSDPAIIFYAKNQVIPTGILYKPKGFSKMTQKQFKT